MALVMAVVLSMSLGSVIVVLLTVREPSEGVTLFDRRPPVQMKSMAKPSYPVSLVIFVVSYNRRASGIDIGPHARLARKDGIRKLRVGDQT